MKVFIKVIRFILIMILTVSIVSLVFVNLAGSTILSKQYILGKLDETFYYKDVKEEIESNFENYIGQSGLDEEVMQNIVTEEKIKEDTGIILNNIYDGTSQEISTEEIEQNLRNNIQESLDEELSATQEKMVDQYVDTICDQYLKVMVHTSYENEIHSVLNKVNGYLDLAKKVSIIGIVVSALFIIISDCKKIVKALAHLGTSLLSSGIFGIITYVFINMKIKISNIVILNDAISEVIKNVLNNILDTVKNQGVILLVIGIVMILIGNGIQTYLTKTKEKNIDEDDEILE